MDAPTAASFGRVLHEIDSNWQQDYPALSKIVGHLNLSRDNWGLEPVWSCMDYYAKLGHAIGNEPDPPWSDESPQLKKALLKIYGQRCDKRADQLPLNDRYTLVSCLKNELQPGDYLISFNYDTVVERVARRLDIQLCSAARENDRIVLAKPHGSTSWILRSRTENGPGSVDWTSSDGGPRLDSMAESDVRGATITGNHRIPGREPLVLGAVPIKSELIKEVQECNGVPSVFSTIQEQWKAVVTAICGAESLVILGYSFPTEDEYGRFLMKEAVRRRDKGRKLDIAFYEVEERQAQVAMRIAEVFLGCIGKLTFSGPVSGPSAA